MRRLGLFLAALIAAACTATPPETVAPSNVTPSAAPPAAPASPLTPAPVATAQPTPSLAPSPVPSPVEAGDAEPLAIRWHAEDPSGINQQESPFVGIARSGDSWVLVGELPYRDETFPFAAWWSTDGRDWRLAQEFPQDERILSLTAGGPGFVAGGFGPEGASIWTSPDGKRWGRVPDASVGQGVVRELVVTDGGIVGFGSEWQGDTDIPKIWTSPNGTDWLAATNETGLSVARGLHALGTYEGRAVAAVDVGDASGLAVWETAGRADWTRTGTLPNAIAVSRVAGGPRGWVALGSTPSMRSAAWTSSDGRAWSDAVTGPDVDTDLVADVSGFVAVGFVGSLPGETCGDQRPFAGHTWTSADGRTWEQMPVTKGFRSAMVTHLVVVERTLVGYGLRLPQDGVGMPLGRWTAHLPDIALPADESDKGTVPETCGG